jgi:hypothetical protein
MRSQGKRLWLAALVAAGLWAQDPPHAWTMRPGRALMDMPADDSGVDVPLDETAAQERLKKYGIGVAKGESVVVTLVKRKGDHIEVHLNGGGFTNRELLTLPGIDSVRWGMSEEEKRIRRDIASTRDKDRRRRLESRYDSARIRRVSPLRKAYEKEQRAKRGSRFNVRLKSDAVSDLEQALSSYFVLAP